MNQEILHELFVDQIKDLYDAEKQLTKALPKMAKAAESDELQEAIRHHLEETQNQVTRLESVFEAAGVPAKGKTCKAMKGLLEEGTEAMQEDAGPLRDLAIIAAAQRVEHYEISAYGTARTLAEHLGMEDAADLLRETEDEEESADSKLTECAIAIYGDAGEDEEEGEEMDEEEGEEAGAGQPAATGTGRSAGRESASTKKPTVKRAGGR